MNEKIIEFINQSPQRSIFSYPWWLEAVTGNNYEYKYIENGGHIQSVLPIFETTKFGIKKLTPPPYTQFNGPLLPEMKGKYVTGLSNEHHILEEIALYLEKYNYIKIRCHPQLTNWLPFYWKSYEETARYTYLLPDISDPDLIWDNMRGNIRREIRKARKLVEVEQTQDVSVLLQLYKKTFVRQEKSLPHQEEMVRRIVSACQEREQGQILIAVDSDNRTHAAIFLVWDDRMAHYLIGGAEPELRNSGAQSFLLWEALNFLQPQVRMFNFEGS
ncbi:MAG TPA: GNAT family N-acetyltransferase, partial [Bacteroidales bacterium]|nr:GNAT family N-acetyltransferase [Bacteroidales bacterium]